MDFNPGAWSQHYTPPNPPPPTVTAVRRRRRLYPHTVFAPDPRPVSPAAGERALRCVSTAVFPQADPSGQAAADQPRRALDDLWG